MNPFKRNDIVWFQGEKYIVKFADDLDVLIENTERRLRVHYLTVSSDF